MKKIYYKKYPKEKYKPMKDAYNRIPQDLYKETDKIMIPIQGERFQDLCETQISKLEHKQFESTSDSIDIDDYDFTNYDFKIGIC